MQPHYLVTMYGLPVEISLAWPYHRSTSGGDFYVLHGTVLLKDGSGLLAEVSANLTQTIAQSLPSLESKDCEHLVLNAIRKSIDNGHIEFLKTAKLQPVEVSSRYYSFLEKKLRFMAQPEKEVLALLKRKVFWLGQKQESAPNPRVWISDPCDCQYVGQPVDKMLELAGKLASEGLIKIDGEHASATDTLLAQNAFFHEEVQNGLARSRAHYNPAMLAKKA
ncbi:MAG: hypothetical protein ACRD2M_04695 [Terriglobales bacterium]